MPWELLLLLFLGLGYTIFSFFSLYWLLSSLRLSFFLFFWTKDSICDTLFLLKDLVDHELMIIICIQELNFRLCIWIEMRAIIISFFNFLQWLDNLTNVDSG